jgi:outer membrane protein OmpA-like peptidoglycan-associated protein
MRIFFFLLLCCSANIAFAQAQPFTATKLLKGKAKDNYDKHKEMLRVGKYTDAIKYLDAAYKADPMFIDALALKASIYNAQRNFKMAEESFEAMMKISDTYDTDVWFSLAQTEKNQEKYLEAVEHYEKFLAAGSKSEIAIKQAKANLETCRFIGNAIANPVPFDPKPLSSAINTTENSEYLPCLTADGETLIFTRRERGDENFMISHKKDSLWEVATPMANINTINNEGAETISADGKYLVFTACNRPDGFGSCDLYFSELSEKGWTTPKNMGEPICTKAWESQPSLSADGRTLYFSSSRLGGLGGQDVWMSKRDKSGWSTPINLGPNVNTTADESGPFIHQDNQTLYFMSNGRPGMGGFDLYYTRKDEKGEWGKPENMGYPINTQRDEGSLIISLDGKKGMMASDRKYKNTKSVSVFSDKDKSDWISDAETDIYEFELYEAARPKVVTYVKGKVYDVTNFQNLRAKVEITDIATNELISTTVSDWKGEFLLCLPAGKSYAFTVNRAKYAFYSNNFSLENKFNFEKPFELNVPLIPLQANATTSTEKSKKTVILKNVFFETASAKLLPTSIAELDRLKVLLDENPTLRIQLNGHTDSEGSEDYNKTLSSNRAKAVYDYLIQKGIAANRLQFKGFGESQPIMTNETPEGRQENRRTEFEILSL